MQIAQCMLILLFPYVAIKLVHFFKTGSWLSPVVLAYGIGILLANCGCFIVDTAISHYFSQATILFAIPLLLYSNDFMAWFRNSRTTLLSFFLCILAVVLSVSILAFVHPVSFAKGWMVSGMLVGVYSGGTPNMQAVGMALGAEEQLYVLLNAADIFCGGLYLLILTSVAHRLLAFVLPDFAGDDAPSEAGEPTIRLEKTNPKDLLKSFTLTMVILLVAAGITWLTPGGLKNSGIMILLLTSFSIIASFSAKVKSWIGTYEAGEYLLLMFCVAVGLLSDFSSLLAQGGEVIGYTGAVLVLAILFHLLLCRAFGIDRDTAMITSTAAIYGPVFVGQVASAIGNRQLVVGGIACGLTGIAVGNYLGIGVAWILKGFL